MNLRAWPAALVLVLSACGTPSTPVAHDSDLTPDALLTTASAFFHGYLDCMSTPPAAAAGNVGVYCQTHSAYATAKMPSQVDSHGVAAAGADPITCGQNPPQGFTVDTPTLLTATTGTAIVVEEYNPAAVLITIDLVLESGTVLVDDVHCPAP